MANRVVRALALAGVLAASACGRIDPLAVIDNYSKTALFEDAMVGGSTRMICVARKLAEVDCTLSTASVVVRDLRSIDDFESGWRSDNEIIVELKSGRVVRFEPTALNGEIRILVTRSAH